MSFINNAVDFLKINSISRKGNEEIINFLIPFYEKIGAKIVIQQLPHSIDDYSKRQFNIIGILGDTLIDPSQQKGLLLVSHVDTSISGNETKWDELDGKPWSAEVKGDRIYGLGAASAKLDFLCKLRAVENYQQFEFKQPVYLVATCGGESILSGNKYLIQSKIVNPKYVLLGHPTNLELGYSHKGRLTLSTRLQFMATAKDAQEYNARIRIMVGAKSGAIWQSHQKKSAIDNLFELLAYLEQQEIALKLFNIESDDCFNKISEQALVDLVVSRDQIDLFRRKFRQYMNDHPDLDVEVDTGSAGSQGIALFPSITLKTLNAFYQEVAKLNEEFKSSTDEQFEYPHSHIAISAVSRQRDSIELFLDFNLIPEHSPTRVKKELEQKVKNRFLETIPSSGNVSVSVRRLFSSAPLYTDPKSELLRALKFSAQRVGIDFKLKQLSSATDAAFYSERGIETIVFGPGDGSSKAYRWNESNELSQLDLATKFYMEVIDAVCVKERAHEY